MQESQLSQQNIIIGQIISNKIFSVRGDQFDDLFLIGNGVVALDFHLQIRQCLILVKDNLLVLVSVKDVEFEWHP